VVSAPALALPYQYGAFKNDCVVPPDSPDLRLVTARSLSPQAVWDRYRLHLVGDLRRRPATVRAYRLAWLAWCAWLADRRIAWDRIGERGPALLTAFLERAPATRTRARGERLKRNTQARDSSTVRCIYRWAHREGLTGAVRELRPLGLARVSPIPLPEAEPDKQHA